MTVRPLITSDAPLWQRHGEIIRICGLGQYLYIVLGLDWVEGWWSYFRARKYYEDMEYRFACIQEHACGLSKTNYAVEDIYRAIDERVREECEKYVEEGCEDGWLRLVNM